MDSIYKTLINIQLTSDNLWQMKLDILQLVYFFFFIFFFTAADFFFHVDNK